MDVRLPNGTLVRNVPEGTTKSQLMAKFQKARSTNPLQPFNRDPRGTPSIGPAEPVADSFSRMAAQVSQQSQAIEQEQPWIERSSTQRAALPVLGGIAGGLMGPTGSTLGALAMSSLGAGGGAGMGELMAQKLSGEELDPAAAAKEGAAAGVGTMAGGTALKGLTATAKSLFSSPLDAPAKAAASFAKEQGVPFPLSSASPGSKAGNIQQGSRLLLPGEVRTQIDANRVAQFLNKEVATIRDAGSPIDEAAIKGQQFLRTVFEPGETVYTQTFKGLREAVGDNAAVPLPNTLPAIQSAAEALLARKATGQIVQQIQGLAKKPPSMLTTQQLDDLYGELLKKAGKNPAARAEMNVVLNAIAQDVDEFAKPLGVNFLDDLTKAKGVRDEFRELRKIPGLERLSKDFGDKGGALGSRQWMSELFGNPNGKALAELRARNPGLYHELADSWLASNIGKFSRQTDSAIGRVLDGNGLRSWFEQNSDKLKLIYGGPQAKALDNFTNYASHMSGSVSRAATGKGLDPTNIVPRAASEIAGHKFGGTMILAPAEAGSYVLAKGLSDPNSTLFRLFTEGVKPSTMKFLEASSKLSGQAAVRSGTDSR